MQSRIAQRLPARCCDRATACVMLAPVCRAEHAGDDGGRRCSTQASAATSTTMFKFLGVRAFLIAATAMEASGDAVVRIGRDERPTTNISSGQKMIPLDCALTSKCLTIL